VNQKPGMEPMTLSRMLGVKIHRILRLVQTSNSVAVYSGHGLQSCWVLGPARSGVEITRTRRIRQILEVALYTYKTPRELKSGFVRRENSWKHPMAVPQYSGFVRLETKHGFGLGLVCPN
jgi:hypothetical protein